MFDIQDSSSSTAVRLRTTHGVFNLCGCGFAALGIIGDMLNPAETTVLCPINDGESKAIVSICQSLGVDLRISSQPWGATLDREPPDNLASLKPSVIIVEMPSTELEDKLSKAGHQVFAVDHHFYPASGLDRRQSVSSLEQVAALFQYPLTRWETGIAINDRDYIFGLLDAGYEMNEILTIRRYDLEAQGISREEFEAVRTAMQTAPVEAGITVLRLRSGKAGFAQDFLVLENPNVVRDLLILTGNPVTKAQFYGDPEKVNKLAHIGEWMGGGKKSKFWGTNHPNLTEIFQRLGLENIKDQISKIK